MGEGGQRYAPGAILAGKKPGTHSIGGRVGPTAGLEEYGKSRPQQDSIPDRPAHTESLGRLGYTGLRFFRLSNETHKIYHDGQYKT
jgi:hypothetical protein